MAISDNMRVMKVRLEKYANLIIVGLLAVVFFVATSSFNYFSQDPDYVKWSSPDETANYFFSRRLSQTGQLAVFDPAAVWGDNMVMPRSLRSDFGWLKPVSFLGIVLVYGSIGGWLGVAVIPFLTPFFAALGIIFFYLLIRRLFSSERVALWSAFLLASFPVYIYYTVRSMFHNILFIVLLIVGFYLLVLAIGKRREKKKERFFAFNFQDRPWPQFLFAFLSGLLFGLAIVTRTSELLWLLPVLFLVWLFYARRIGLTRLFLFLAGMFLAFLPTIYWNTILYNAPFYGGYNEMNRSLDTISRAGSALVGSTLAGRLGQYRDSFLTIAKQIFYFGFNAPQSVAMFQHYVLEMFPILLYGGLLGFVILVIKNIRRFEKKYLVYVLALGILSLILVFYYGSWRFNDNPNPNSFTIGNSYTRYWLPIYLLLIPLLSLAIYRLSRALLLMGRAVKDNFRPLLAFALQAMTVIVIAYFGINFVLYGSEEGLAYLYYNNQLEKASTERVLELTEPEAIIITRYYDKFFFPERRVIMGTLPNDEILTAAAKLVHHYPVYYYNFYLNEADVQYLNERKLAPYNLKLETVRKINARFGLYRLKYEKPTIEK